MATITQTLIQNLQVTFSSAFAAAWRDTPQYWDRVCTSVPSTTALNTYGWMKRLPKMREWVGTRVLHNLDTRQASLANRKFEFSFGVPRTDIADDQVGIFKPMFEMAGRSQGYIWNQLFIQALLAGDASTLAAAQALVDDSAVGQGLAFDGVDFFHATGHDLGGGQIVNKGSEELTPTGWNTVKERMRNYKGEDGRHLGVLGSGRPLIVAPATGGYERALKMMFGRQLVAGGESNIYQGEADWILIPELASTVGWYVFDVSSPIKALIMQKREEQGLVSKTEVTSENVFHLDEFLYGSMARGNCGYGPFFLAYHATGTSPDGREVLLTDEQGITGGIG
jgi:phage major head subunit gpT-like protein